VAVSPRHKFAAYWDEIDKFRGHAMTAGDDYSTASVVWNSPAYHTASAKWTSTMSDRLLIEGGYSNNTENYTNEYQPGLAKARGSADWYAGASRRDLDLISTTRTPLIANVSTQSPVRFNVQASASYVTGSHNAKVGVQRTWGALATPGTSMPTSCSSIGVLPPAFRSPCPTPSWSITLHTCSRRT